MKYHLYVVDDEQSICDGIQTAMGADYKVSTFPKAEDAIVALESTPPDLVLLDIGLPGMDGIEALRILKKRSPDLLVIMITAYEDVDTVISAMKLGAYDYILKPIHLESLEVTVANALGTISLRKEVQLLQEKYLQENGPCFIIESDALQEVMQFVHNVARSPDTPVLILGETGTGKELIASAIHFRSPQFRGPMVSINCSAIPAELIESELFGYDRGAFSGAASSGKTGLIESAADGTLFLDEVGDLSLEVQAKLLRFLDSGEFFKVGGTVPRKVKTRLVSATNKDISQMMVKGTFRKDLYYRLGVVTVRVPALRERKDDILPLAHHFLAMYTRKFNVSITGLTPEAERWLLRHDWPGNVRELKNRVERAVLLGRGRVLDTADVGDDQASRGMIPARRDQPDIPPEGIDFTQILETIKRVYIEKALEMANGNEAQAARLLNINHHTFRYHAKKYHPK